MGLLVDSSIIIALEREGSTLPDLPNLPDLADVADEPLSLSALTASELLVGVERADTETRRARRRAFVEAIHAAVPVLPVDLEVARIHARLTAELLARGQIIGAHDLLIAATAIRAGNGVLTVNVRDFERVPGLKVRHVRIPRR
ncbi:MAG: PIN domain-containing protein [Chloroflexi bacterium]|nr:PIN domain-containing protein [Chloroflexota bacterium]